MSNLLFRGTAFIVGAIVCLIVFVLMKPILDVLHSFFSAATAPESTGWRTAVTVAGAIILFAIYALTGLIFGYARPEREWKWGLWLAIFPVLLAVVMLLFAGIEYPTTLIVGVLAVFAGGCLGAQLGAYFKQRPAV